MKSICIYYDMWKVFFPFPTKSQHINDTFTCEGLKTSLFIRSMNITWELIKLKGIINHSMHNSLAVNMVFQTY